MGTTPLVLAEAVDQDQCEGNKATEDNNVSTRPQLYKHQDALAHAKRVEHLQGSHLDTF